MSLFIELKRRNVFRVGIAYLVASWLLLQLTEVLTELLELSTDVGKIVIVLILIGFIPALIFSWAFELTPDGIKREKDVDRDSSITPQTGQRLNYITMGMLALIAVYFIYEARFKAPDMARAPAVATSETTPAEAATGTPDAPVIDPNSIAVLPFVSRSREEDDLFFADGMHDDLLTQLAKIDDLKVISRTSVMQYRDTTMAIPDIAAELGVSKILEGGLQRAGDRIRINAQLIDVATDEHLWAETFDREMTVENLFDIQSEITRQIVGAVRGELTDEEQESLAGRPTDSLAAWEAYLHARAIIQEADYGQSKYIRAEPFLLEAVELDPNFADAWAELTQTQLQGIWIGHKNTPEQRALAQASLDRALAADAENPAVILAQADFEYRVNVDYEASLAHLERARQRAPGYAPVYRDLGLSLRRLGRWEAAVEAFEQSMELDPMNSFTAATLIETLVIMNDFERVEPLIEFWLRRVPNSGDIWGWKITAMLEGHGDLEGAKESLERAAKTDGIRIVSAQFQVAITDRDFERMIELNEQMTDQAALPIFGFNRDWVVGQSRAMGGDLESARGAFERYIADHNPDEANGRIAQAMQHIALAQAHAWLGDADRAMLHANRADTLLPRQDDYIFGTNIANRLIWVRAYTGQRDLALEQLAATVDQPGGLTRWRLYLDPAWDFFRDDPRFNDLALPPGVEPEPFRNQRLGDGT